ncbi:MAG: hypothetical protein HOP05_05910 [Ferruginibacter sp.]|nr:hypothetical protein [Ferruginibacter sp.]
MGQQKLLREKVIKLFYFLACYFSVSGCKFDEKVINYFIPRDFTGNIAIIYNNDYHSCDESLVNYQIPNDGILKVKCSFTDGAIISNYIQENSLGNYDTLDVENPVFKHDTSKNRIYFPRILSFSKGVSKEVYVKTFYIGKEKASNLEKDRFFFERRLEDLIITK